MVICEIFSTKDQILREIVIDTQNLLYEFDMAGVVQQLTPDELKEFYEDVEKTEMLLNKYL